MSTSSLTDFRGVPLVAGQRVAAAIKYGKHTTDLRMATITRLSEKMAYIKQDGFRVERKAAPSKLVVLQR
jgi:hypothetical protein